MSLLMSLQMMMLMLSSLQENLGSICILLLKNIPGRMSDRSGDGRRKRNGLAQGKCCIIRELLPGGYERIMCFAEFLYAHCQDFNCCVMRTIPVEWATTNLLQETQFVDLRFEENIWCTRFYHRRTGGGLSAGWKRFVVENSLELSDVHIFKLLDRTLDTIVLEVSIFRAVEEVTPLSRVPKCKRSARYPTDELDRATNATKECKGTP